MNQRIIYKNDTDGVAIFAPAENATKTIEEIAAIVVPTGKPYKIVDVSEIPTDRTDRDLWDVDEADLTDGVGA
jgi:hypothetical protein